MPLSGHPLVGRRDASVSRPPRSRGASRGLLWFIATFVVIQLGLFLVVQNSREKSRYPEFTLRYRALERRLAAEPDRPLLLILGSSRTEVGVRPSALPELRTGEGKQPLVFNFSLSSSGPLEQLLTLRHLLGQGIRPRWVVAEVYPLAFGYRETGAEAYIENGDRLKQLTLQDLAVVGKYYDNPARLYAGWLAEHVPPCWQSREWLVHNFAPAFDSAQARTQLVFEAPDGWISWGATEAPEPDSCSDNVFSTIRQYEFALEHYHCGELPRRALRQFLELCRQNDIQVGMIVTPEHRRLRESFSTESKTGIAELIHSIRSEEAVRLLDAREWLADNYFADGHHLLPGGAAEFSRQLGARLIVPLIQSDPGKPRVARNMNR